jgi:hypothetical protein
MTTQDRMTLGEVSKILDIGINTLQRKPWRVRTGCPLKKIGRRLVAYRPQFNEWLTNYNG